MGRWRLAGAVVGAAVVGVSSLAMVQVSASPVYSSLLTRVPYVTDLQRTTAEVNWSENTSARGYVTYGQAGNCTATKTATVSTKLPPFVPTAGGGSDTTDQYKVNGVGQWQSSIELTGLSAGTSYCYEAFSSTGALLAPSQSFSTLDATLPSTGLTFDVVADLGETNGADESAGFVNQNQANIDSEIGQSRAKFLVTAGDVAYSGGTSSNYGNLTAKPTSATDETSNIFGPSYWPATGGIPTYQASGNHGQINTGLRTFPEETTAQSTGGVYDYVTYPAIAGLAPATATPDDWYAVQDGNVRIYVLDAAWSDGAAYLNTTSATGSACPANQSECEGYQIEAAEHWGQSSKEMTWLKQDLAAHPSQIKFAVFHYPLTSLQTDQQSDVYLDTTLEPVLKGAGVSMAFDGHAHTYQRFVPNAGSNQLISYVSGGGGGVLQPVDGNTDTHGLCAGELSQANVYAIGHSSSQGSACSTGNVLGNGHSITPAQVYNFLKVNVTGNVITVSPTNALGRVFDQQTYTVSGGVTTLGGGTTSPTSTTTSTTSTTTTTTTTGTPPPPTGIKLVTSAGASGPTVTLPQAAPAGDLLVLSASQYTGTTNHISGVSDNAGDTWHLVVAPDSSGHNSEGELWYTYALGSVSAVTAATTAPSIATEVQVFSGVKSGSPPTSGSTSATGTAASASAAAGSLEVGFIAGHGNAEPITLGGGLTPQSQVQSAPGTSISTLITGYESPGGSGTFSGTFGTAMYWASGVAVFPAA